MRPQLINPAHSREEQRALLIAQGWKPTGVMAMDGRFEIVRQPKGYLGASVTWVVWDFAWATFLNGWYGTFKAAKQDLSDAAHGVVWHELRCETDTRYREAQPTRDSS